MVKHIVTDNPGNIAEVQGTLQDIVDALRSLRGVDYPILQKAVRELDEQDRPQPHELRALATAIEIAFS